MYDHLEQFVPQKVCLSCDGCCRFKEEKSTWRPKLTKTEIQGNQSLSLADRILRQDILDHRGYIKTVSCQGQYLCSFFNPNGNICKIYQNRPFECQLYPFILSKNALGETALSVHLLCPHIQEKRTTSEFEAFKNYLYQYFHQPRNLAFLKNNPQLIGDYSQYESEIERLFTLEL